MPQAKKLGKVDLDEIKDQSFLPKKKTEQTFWVKDRNGWTPFVPDHESDNSEFVDFQNNKHMFLDYQTRRTIMDISGDHEKVIRTEIYKDGELKKATDHR